MGVGPLESQRGSSAHGAAYAGASGAGLMTPKERKLWERKCHSSYNGRMQRANAKIQAKIKCIKIRSNLGGAQAGYCLSRNWLGLFWRVSKQEALKGFDFVSRCASTLLSSHFNLFMVVRL